MPTPAVLLGRVANSGLLPIVIVEGEVLRRTFNERVRNESRVVPASVRYMRPKCRKRHVRRMSTRVDRLMRAVGRRTPILKVLVRH